MTRILILLMLLACAVISVTAQEAQPVGEDPVLEKRLNNLAKKLRCLQCQNETIAESSSEPAATLRNEIREQMKAGKSDEEIMAFVVARYGEFILFSPPVKPTTYLLWFGPFALLVGGLVFLFRYLKRRGDLIVDQPLTTDERRRAEQLLEEESRKEKA